MKKIFKLGLLLPAILLLLACAWQSVDRVSSDLNMRLGLACLREKKVVLAKEKLQLAIEQAPDSSDAQLAMGYFYLTVEEFQRAQKYYYRALRLNPKSGRVQNDYGVFLCQMGRYRQAIHYFVLAAHNAQYSKNAMAYQNAGLCALKIPDKVLASHYFRRAKRYQIPSVFARSKVFPPSLREAKRRSNLFSETPKEKIASSLRSSQRRRLNASIIKKIH